MSAAATPKVRALVLERANGKCERCYRNLDGHSSLHHRIPRGMGGSKNPVLGQPANLLYLCGSGVTGCHGWTESHRTSALAAGLLLPRIAVPRLSPFTDAFGWSWRISDDGAKYPDPHAVTGHTL